MVGKGAYLENVQTDRATCQINVWMITWCIELDRRGGIRVVGGEGDGNLKT